MIRFGPAGIPLSCKGRTLEDGIEDVHNLSLTALEIQMIRAKANVTYPDEDFIGYPLRAIQNEMFVVEVDRDGELLVDPDTIIEEDDALITVDAGIASEFGSLYDLGTMAKRLDVSLSLHTPHYMDLGSNSQLTDNCIEAIMRAGLILNALDGDIVVTNLGLYNLDNDEEVENNIYENVASIMDWWHDIGIKPKLGIEITGHRDVFGSLEQVCDICREFEGLVPVINWPNYQSRSRDNDIRNMILDSSEAYLLEEESFMSVIEDVAPFYKNGESIHTSFSGIEHTDDNLYRLTPIKKGDLKFETLAECLVNIDSDMTIISSSPLLEHDAMYMRTIYERDLIKKVGKMLRQKKKDELAAAADGSSEGPSDGE